MPDETQKERHAPHVLTTLAGVLIAFLLLAAIYVVYQARTYPVSAECL